MEILINNQKYTVSDNSPLKDIANSQLGAKQNGVAIAINDTVIPKINWDTHILKPNDHILIIKATQGG